MATWDDVRRIALSLPGTNERSSRQGASQWRAVDKLFAWERPLGKRDLEALGAAAPDRPVLAARVPGLVAKEALLAGSPHLYFTIPHFDGYPAILVRLERTPVSELEDLLIEAWIDRAPKRLVKDYVAAENRTS